MSAFAKPLSSTAWILAHAAAAIRATSATVAFGGEVTVLTGPGQRPTQVHEMTADASTERFDQAMATADRLLHLSTPGTVRLLAVVSDGWFYDVGFDVAQTLITRLHRTGCGILWLAPGGRRCHTFTHTTTVTVDDPAAAVDIIARAAVTALTATGR